jgi:hypothetical protein
MSKVEIIVKVDDAYTAKISGIANECKANGMSVDQQMSSAGMITGSIERANISKIERINGVSYVEESRAI